MPVATAEFISKVTGLSTKGIVGLQQDYIPQTMMGCP